MVGEYYLASFPDTGGRITVESAATCSWNGWQNVREITGNMFVEFALYFREARAVDLFRRDQLG